MSWFLKALPTTGKTQGRRGPRARLSEPNLFSSKSRVRRSRQEKGHKHVQKLAMLTSLHLPDLFTSEGAALEAVRRRPMAT